LLCEAAVAGDVDDEDDFAFEVRERVGLLHRVQRLEVVEGGCGRHCAGLSWGD